VLLRTFFTFIICTRYIKVFERIFKEILTLKKTRTLTRLIVSVNICFASINSITTHTLSFSIATGVDRQQIFIALKVNTLYILVFSFTMRSL
jgi:hypothetical protein